MKKTQKERILAWLEKDRALTPLGALEMFGCFRLAAVCFKLRKEGHTIITKPIKNRYGTTFASYTLIKPKK